MPAALAAPALSHGTLREFNVELPNERPHDGGTREALACAHALATVAVPTGRIPAANAALVVRETFAGKHEVEAELLRTALLRFRALRRPTAPAN